MVDTHTNTGKAAFAAALAAVVIGVCVLAGWLFDLEFFKRIVPGFVAMNPATAVAFILAGASLALFLWSPHGRDQKSRAPILTARLCALVVALIGLAKLVGILGGWDLGVDRWLFASQLPDSLRFPNRIAPNTAFNFLLLGGALLFVDVKNRSARFWSEFSVVLVGFGSLLAVMAYAYDIQSFYGFSVFIPMALHTAITFSVLAVAFLLSHTDGGLLAVFAGDSAGGKLARRLLPAVVLVPAVLGWLTLQGEKAGIHHGAFGEAVEAVGDILVLTFLVCWSAKVLFREDLARKKAEEALRESEERFSGAFEHAPIGVALVSPDGHWLKTNRALCDLVGYSEAELLTRTFQDITHPEDLEVSREKLRRMIAGEIRSFQIEKRYVHKRGHFITALTNISLVRDGQGQPLYFISQIQDITARKQAETALRESEARTRLLVTSSSIGLWDWNLVTNEVFFSEEWKSQLGYTDAELPSRFEEWESRLHPEDREPTLAAVKGYCEGRRADYEVEFRLRHKDGSWRWMLTRANLTRDATGQPAHIMGCHIDITDRKQGEESLRLLGSAVEQAKESILITDAELDLPGPKIIFVNPAFTKMTGYTAAEVLGKTPRILQGPHSDRAVLRRLRETLGRGGVFDGETTNYRKDGTEFNLEWQIAPIRNATGKITHFVGMQRDITERKQAEHALRESDEKFHQLADNITDAFWIRSPDMREVHYISPAFERIWGRSVASLHANPQQWADFILPEDRERVLGAFVALTGDVPSLDIEYRIVRPEGEVRWVRVRGFQVRDAAGKLIRHIGIVTDITERHHAAEKLRESERRFSDMLRNLELVSLMLDQNARITWCNDYLLRLTGWQRDEVIGRDWFEVFLPPELVAQLQGIRSQLLADQPAAWHHENEILTKSGARRLIRWNNSVLRSPSGEVIGTASIGEDITERKRLEAQLFQSQKMETVGKLAGGIAHEFNSILTAIMGQSELLLGDLPAGSPLVKNATEISKAAGRAATLTRQLLAYGRKAFLRPESLDLNQAITSMEGTVRHLMGRDVDTQILPAPGLRAVKVDAGQIEQVIINIAMNAADAMPNGGKLTLETANVSFDLERVGSYPELKPGDYVMLAITDTGTGMSEAVKARAFEPFFTTKGVGQGTGLGLSTCYGIIKQSGGHISVYSEPGRGTTFKIYLPQVESRAKIPLQRLDSPDLPRGTETILLAEDDPALREMAATLLRRLGYTVLTAANGVEALSLNHQPDTGHIDLLFTDVVMPHMSGKELSERVRALYPRTKILFTSAYTENAIVHQGVLNEGVALLQKPFTPSALAHKLREVLDGPGASKPDFAQKTFGFTKISDAVTTLGN